MNGQITEVKIRAFCLFSLLAEILGKLDKNANFTVQLEFQKKTQL